MGTPDLGERVRHLRDGFSIRVALDRGAVFQTHLVVAWAAESARSDTTRLAVDRTRAEVLWSMSAPGA
jgi:hypothetical protein